MKYLAIMAQSALVLFAILANSGCSRTEAKQPAPQPMPVKTQTVSLEPVPRADEYVATVKSRRSASIQPQVTGTLTRILVKSGDHVRAGQVLMTIDPLKQQATVDEQRSTEAQKKALYDYNQIELERQRVLYESGVTSKQSYDQAVQAFANSKADWEAATAAKITQQRELAYYNLQAPFAGIVGDIPVHLGDYVSSQTLLTTVDENQELEAVRLHPDGTGWRHPHGSPRANRQQHWRTHRKFKDLFRLAAGGQRSSGCSGEGAHPHVARPVPQRTTGEGAGDLEHGPHANRSGTGGDAYWRAALRLRSCPAGERTRRQAARSNSRRHHRQ